jgi:Anti-sigma-K factor rskA/Sigma-70, region 4
MATFDQLAADQRAIIEIVLRQDRSYEQIGEMLDLPPARVRELARDALGELAPHTAELVDPQWRGQLADYVLGQQTGPEAQATRGHLKRSEPARIWAYSLLDALGDFFPDGGRPEIPVGEAGLRTRASEQPPAANGDAGAPVAAPRRSRTAGGPLSPAAQSALMRRRVLGGLGAVVLVALLIFGAIKLFGGDDNSGNTASTSTGTSTSASGTGNQAAQGTVVAQAVLAPVGKSFKGTGAALVYQSGNQSLAVVRAKLPPSTGKNKYVLWLYDSEKKLAPLAADVTDKQGNFQGAAALPNGWQSYHFFDLTYQPTSGTKVGHGRSVMRGPLTAPQQQSNGGGTGTGTGTSTGTTTTP